MPAQTPSSSDLLVSQFILSLSKGEVETSYNMAVKTAEMVKALVECDDWGMADQLIKKVRMVCKRLEEDLPQLHVVHNMIKRILKLIREEYLAASKSVEAECQPESLQKMLKSADNVSDWGKTVSDLKERVFEIIEELMIELETSCEEISKQAIEHIHANEIILTIGRSRTVEKFLKHAAKTRKFEVIVAEAAPGFSGHQMATSLAKAKISTTVITDSAIFAMMARVNKVIIGTTSILADGGVVAISGSRTVALAAKHYSVPLIVLGAVYKLTPRFMPEGDTQVASMLVSPAPVLQGLDSNCRGKLRCVNPLYDCVPPSLVTLFISNIAGYSPSYVYRQMGDLYHQEDKDL